MKTKMQLPEKKFRSIQADTDEIRVTGRAPDFHDEVIVHCVLLVVSVAG